MYGFCLPIEALFLPLAGINDWGSGDCEGREEESIDGFLPLGEVIKSTVSKGIEKSKYVNMDEYLSNNSTLGNTEYGLKSFANATRPGAYELDNKQSLIHVIMEERREVVIFEEDIIMEGTKKRELTLCGFFVGFKMSYFGIKFKEDECMNVVLEIGTWMVKENQEKDKIGSKPDKNGKRGEAGKSLKQLQLKEEEKPKKAKKMAKNAYTDQKLLNFKEKKKRKWPKVKFLQSSNHKGQFCQLLILVTHGRPM
nr:hypothetical protein [Tanacetum cinerariifolium]